MENIKTETLIITILIIYVVSAFALTSANFPGWTLGLILAGFCILFFPVIVKYSNRMMRIYFNDKKSMFYIIFYMFFVVLTVFYVLQSVFYGLKEYGKKE